MLFGLLFDIRSQTNHTAPLKYSQSFYNSLESAYFLVLRQLELFFSKDFAFFLRFFDESVCFLRISPVLSGVWSNGHYHLKVNCLENILRYVLGFTNTHRRNVLR